MDRTGPIAELLALQCGVLARRQALAAGLTDGDLRRLVRRRELTRLHPGVLLDHTGTPTWLQRAWAACLYAWPAALARQSALRAADGPGRREALDDEPIHVAVDRHRRLVEPPGVRLHRTTGLEHRALMNLGPPRLRAEEAVLDLAAEAEDDFAAVQALADAVQARRTTAARLTQALAARSRIARRPFLAAVLADVGDGACSVLEHGYLVRVERAHGLPRGGRQVRASLLGPAFRDVEYAAHGLVVELDGRLHHSSATARDADLDRDLLTALDGRRTVRLGWGQVYRRPCLTAERVGVLLRHGGWAGTPTRCPECRERG